jgi:hypothetical protein
MLGVNNYGSEGERILHRGEVHDMAAGNDDGNGRIKWRDFDRIAGVAVVIVTMVYYFSGFERRLDAIDLKLAQASTALVQHSTEDKTRREFTAYTHSVLVSPLDCRKCMGRNGGK